MVFRLDGYQEQTVNINRSLSAWIFGNIIFGGIPGIIVDAITGGWATISPGQVSIDLEPTQNPAFGPPQAPLLPSPNASPP